MRQVRNELVMFPSDYARLGKQPELVTDLKSHKPVTFKDRLTKEDIVELGSLV